MDEALNIISYTFATMAGLCFILGVAVITSGGINIDGRI